MNEIESGECRTESGQTESSELTTHPRVAPQRQAATNMEEVKHGYRAPKARKCAKGQRTAEINTVENTEENYEPINNDEDMKSNVEIPPQRDIRDTQPTISVNYRVIKNTEENNLRPNKNNSNITGNNDDWDNDENDW